MQKIDLRNYLKHITESLKSQNVVDLLGENQAISASNLIKLIIESKSGYDNALSDSEKNEILSILQASQLYSSDNITNIVSFASPQGNKATTSFLLNEKVLRFLIFHKTILNSFNLIDTLLLSSREIFDEKNNFNAQYLKDKGIVTFQLIDKDKLSLNKLDKVVHSLKEITDTVNLVLEKLDNLDINEPPKIIYVDSGSKINFIIKIPEKAANTLSELFKEFWDYIVHRKYLRHEKNNTAIEDSIDILKKIKNARDDQIITPEEAEIWKRGIIKNTENIVFNNTLTKEIIDERAEITTEQLLLEQTEINRITFENETHLIENEGDEEEEEQTG